MLDKEVFVKYQKIVDVWNNAEPIGYESTVEGVNGESAANLFRHAEKTGTLEELDRVCRWKAVMGADKIWEDGKYLFINVSTYSVSRGVIDFPRTAELDKIVLEVTEHLEITKDVKDTLYKLRSKGIQLALDDFGKGYSNLELLTTLPFTFIKLDKSFCKNILRKETLHVIKHMNLLCNDSGKKLIVEGVENVRQKDILMDLGIRYMQGFYFGYPERVKEGATFLVE